MTVRVAALAAVVAWICWAIWPSDRAATVAETARAGSAARAAYHAMSSPAWSDPTRDVVIDPAAPRVRVEGQVVDQQKRPIGGATVRVLGLSATTETDGSFFFDDIPAGDVLLTAERDGWYGETRESIDADTSEPVEIEVRRGSTLAIRVVRKGTATPIAGAKIEVGSFERITDSDGRALLRGLDPTGERVRVTADGYGSLRQSVEFDREQLDVTKQLVIELSTGAEVRGYVVDETGARVPEASVTIIAVDESWTDGATADANGEFTIAAIAPGKHVMSATSDAHVQTPEQLIETDGTTKSGVVIHVTTGAVFSGRVVDTAGKPVKGATLSGVYGAGETDDDGRFRAIGLEAGELTVFAKDATRASDEKKFTVGPGLRTEGLFVLRDGSLAGRVVTRSGEPVADASVYAEAISNGDKRSFFASSDENGRFDFEGVPPADYTLTAVYADQRANDAHDVPVRAHSGRRDVKIVLPDRSLLIGRVVLDGAPVPYFGVYVATDPTQLYSASSLTVDAPDGSFTHEDVRPGTYSVVIIGPNFANTIVPATIVEGETTDLGTITVGRGRTLTGRVTDGNGRGIANAHVIVGRSLSSIASDRVDQRAQGDATTHSGPDGRFELVGLAGGEDELNIVARIDGGTSIERVLAPTETTVELVILATGSITGRIENFDGNQSMVNATSDEAGIDQRFSGDIDRAGTYVIENVPAGQYKVSVSGRNSLPTKSTTVVVGRSSPVDFALPRAPISVELALNECTIAYLVIATDDRVLSICTDEAKKTHDFHAVEPGTHQVCTNYDQCITITVAPSPAKQTITATLPPRR